MPRHRTRNAFDITKKHENTTWFEATPVCEEVITQQGFRPRQSAKSECKTLDADFRISAEVNKEPEFALGDSKVIEKLRLMFICKLADGLKFDNDLVVTEQVGNVLLLNGFALVENR